MTPTLSAAALLSALLGADIDPPTSSPLPISGPAFDFGDDGGEYPRDGECDDPRFTGDGMASSTDAANIGGDATDCRRHFDLGNVRLVRTRAQSSLAECATIDFGNDASDWARDGECDDPRFTGPGVHDIAIPEDLRTDATDCRALCASGRVWLK